MNLSPEREAQLIEENMPKIYRAVDNYRFRCKSGEAVCVDYSDFVQEVTIVFLNHIRKCNTEEEIDKFPWYDAMHAMSEYVLLSQPLSVPKSTKQFSTVINSIPHTVSYEVCVSNGMDVDGMSKHWVPDKETEIDFNAFMAEQGENIQRIAAMRIYGMTIRDIAAQFGVAKNAIDKKIKRLREKYDIFDSEEDDQ